MRTLMRGGIGAFIVVRTLPWGIQNVVDKLLFREESMVLRCVSKILPMLCPILIGPLFYQGFHTKDGLDFLLAHGYRPVRPVRHCLLFLSSSVAPFTSFGPSLFYARGASWGDGKNNPDGSMFMGRWMRYRREWWKIEAKMTIVNTEWTVTQSVWSVWTV